MIKAIYKIKSFKNNVIRYLDNEEGNGLIAGIIVSAIILIALVLLNTPIRTFISSIWDLFSNFVEGKLSTLFSS
ncbi:MAG: hypothetical protein EWM50_05550 [Gottschalkiaceae bacterium]|nr:MAG: hypothetical protein EWM50_05550 [Gottschalkiaceae bacterium]